MDQKTPYLDALQLSDLLHRCQSELHQALGFRVEQTRDFDAVSAIADNIGKPFFNGHLSPDRNDFFTNEAFWLILKKEDQPIGMVGARFNDTGHDNLGDLYRRRLGRLYPEIVANLPADRAQPHFAHRISGKVLYFGDLFIVRDHTRPDTNYLDLIMTMMFILGLMSWPQIDWMYSFMRDKDMRDGRAYRYGFTRQYKFASSWGVGETGSALVYGLAVLPRADLEELLAGYLMAPDRLRVVEEKRSIVNPVPDPKVKASIVQ